MKKILVTGAAGFVGKNLMPILAKEENINHVIFVDKNPIPLNIKNELEQTKLRLTAFLSNKIPVNSATEDVNAIICLAGATSVDAALAEPRKAIDENVALATDLAEWARLVNPSVKIIYMSSDEVLGESYVPLDENAPLKPTQPYAASKAAAEIVLHNYRDVYMLNIATIRSCNLVGAFQKRPKLIPTAVEELMEKRPVPIQGDGNQLREWMAVEDLCRAIILLLQNDVTPQVYQATSGVKISVNDVAKIVAESIGVELKTIQVPDRLVQDRSYAMQAKRLNSLGWYPISDPRDAIRYSTMMLAREVFERLVFSNDLPSSLISQSVNGEAANGL
ncbi:MAG: NAD-dependent epimerase/dehydratase family protein [Anaerolineales bacterium]|nr:NAD-dependent epimerase/dehydratase family protein [Anaerolineales bacterium]